MQIRYSIRVSLLMSAICVALSACGGGSEDANVTKQSATPSATSFSAKSMNVSHASGVPNIPAGSTTTANQVDSIDTVAQQQTAFEVASSGEFYNSSLSNAPPIVNPYTYYTAEFPVPNGVPATPVANVSWTFYEGAIPYEEPVATYLCHGLKVCLNISSRTYQASGVTTFFNTDNLPASTPFYLYYGNARLVPINLIDSNISVSY